MNLGNRQNREYAYNRGETISYSCGHGLVLGRRRHSHMDELKLKVG
jgi:hypothetical protein